MYNGCLARLFMGPEYYLAKSHGGFVTVCAPLQHATVFLPVILLNVILKC